MSDDNRGWRDALFGKKVSIAQSMAAALTLAFIGKFQINHERGFAVKDMREAVSADNISRVLEERLEETSSDDPLHSVLLDFQELLKKDPEAAKLFADFLESELVDPIDYTR